MRPLRLSIQAFGPFAGRQVLDFADLRGRSLFLISGPTGCGKTTILDAICFALYGTTSGEDRKPEQMRSQHAPPTLAPEVTFDFALGAETWRVRRWLDHDREARRGKGVTHEKASAALWRRTGVADPASDGDPIATGLKDVTLEVTRLIGFRDDEFRQVVLIPQGRFRELLTVTSQDREKVLRTLFQTGRFSAIEAALRDAFAGVRRDLEGIREQRKGVLDVEGVASEEGLSARHEAETAAAAEARRASGARQVERDAAADALASGRAARAILDEAVAAASERARLASRAGEMEAAGRRLERARAARLLIDAEAESDRARAEAEDRRSDAGATARTLDAAKEEHSAATSVAEAARARRPEEEAARQAVERLRELAEPVAGLANARKAADRATGVSVQAERDVEGAKGALAKAEEGLAARKARLAEVEPAARSRDAAVLACAKARTTIEDRDRLDAARKKASRAEAAHQEALREAEARAAAHVAATAAVERLERAQHEGAAALLARDLRDGAPCPVCGSAVHPSPAAGGEDLPDRAALDALRDDAKRAEEALSEARGKAERAGAALAEERGRAEVLRASLGSAADQDRAALESALGDMESRAAGAEAAESERQRISGEVADLEARIVALRGALEAARGALRSTEADKAAVHATLRGIEERVPEAWRDPSAHARAAREAERLLASLSTAREAADVRLSAAVAALAAAVEREGAARTVADRTAADAARRASAFAARREEAGFASPSEYAEAKLDDAEAEMLDRAIEDWKAACAAAKDREARAEAAARGVAEPDLPALEAAAEAAGRAYDSASKAAGAAQGRVEHLEGVLAKLAGSAERSARLEAEYGVLCGLSQAASGDNEMRLTFQSWVLGALLDDVLIATSARLREMSGGRYALQRSRSVTDRRRAAGLDLDVSDAYTGLERPATTLSGGESFMAALALALGLADVVQSQSGGIRLDTIFIDEGFGSLDPEALDLALRVLSRLHEGGRLVGIISHVPELKRRIDARLEVTAGKTGSRAGFVL